jgi:hypothetical protein
MQRALVLFAATLSLAVSAQAQEAAAPPAPATPAPARPPAGEAPGPAVGSQPATTDEIVAAVRDCSEALAPGTFDNALLNTRGWRMARAPISRPGPGDRQTTLMLYAREGGQVVNVINITGRLLVHCSTFARITDRAQVDAVRAALIPLMGATPATQGTVEERDRAFVNALPADQQQNMLLSATRRIALLPQDGDRGIILRIEIFTKRPPQP